MASATIDEARIIIPHGDGRMPLRVIRCFGSIKSKFTLLSKDRDNVARASKYCSEFVFSDPHSDDQLLAQLESLPQSDLPEIILPITTEGFLFVSKNKHVLKTRFRLPPIASPESLVTASDKWKLYDFAKANQLPVLDSVPISSVTDQAIERGNLKLEFPSLVKTRESEGGSGFQKVESMEELIELRDRLSSQEVNSRFVQRFIEGRDISLSLYCEKGEIKCYTIWSALLYGKLAYKIPICIQFEENDRILEIGKRLARLLRWEGVCDIDFFMDQHTGEIWLLEINARFWGNLVGCASQGVDFLSLMCQQALGIHIDNFPKQTHGIYCYPKGLPAGLRNSSIRRSILKNPLKATGTNTVLRDIGPEFYKLFLKIKNRFK